MKGNVGRQAKMYEFDVEKYKRLEKHGFNNVFLHFIIKIETV